MAKIDWTTMILAIVLSVFLWVYVHVMLGATENTRTLREIPVTPVNKIAAGLSYRLHEDSARVDVQIKGPADLVNSVTRDDIAVHVDLSKVTAAKTTILKPEIQLPRGVRLGNDPKVTLLVAPLRRLSFPVTVTFIAQPPPGSVVGQYIISPASVFVEGSRDDIELVKYVTVRLDPNQPLTADHSYIPVPVDAEGKPLNEVSVSDPTVKVHMASPTGKQPAPASR